MHGGLPAGEGSVPFDDLWIWSEGAWAGPVQAAGAAPGPRAYHSCCAVPGFAKAVYVGGFDGRAQRDEVFVLSLKEVVPDPEAPPPAPDAEADPATVLTWTSLPGPAPSGRVWHSAIFADVLLPPSKSPGGLETAASEGKGMEEKEQGKVADDEGSGAETVLPRVLVFGGVDGNGVCRTALHILDVDAGIAAALAADQLAAAADSGEAEPAELDDSAAAAAEGINGSAGGPLKPSTWDHLDAVGRAPAAGRFGHQTILTPSNVVYIFGGDEVRATANRPPLGAHDRSCHDYLVGSARSHGSLKLSVFGLVFLLATIFIMRALLLPSSWVFLSGLLANRCSATHQQPPNALDHSHSQGDGKGAPTCVLNLRPDAEAVNPTRVKDATWTVALPNGDRYQGDWDASGDLRHGSGRCEYASGDVYDGRWSSDQRGVDVALDDIKVPEAKEGKAAGAPPVGTMTWASGSRYVGGWKYDRRNGHGVWTAPPASTLDGSPPDAVAQWEGPWADDEPAGQGVATFADGSRISAAWCASGGSEDLGALQIEVSVGLMYADELVVLSWPSNVCLQCAASLWCPP